MMEASNANFSLPAPFGPTPSPAQLLHAEHPFYAFCHFTVDTFTNKEWGDGDEDPAVFNPTQFDADQIVSTLKFAGCAGVILTCKHHDGFCLWPTKATEHNVSKSPFKPGDVVREFSLACKNRKMEFGVYLSPWDRNNEHYGDPEYVTDVYRKQMRELLTQYGPIFEVWLDGANGGTGYYGGKGGARTIDRSHYYDWPTTWAMIRELQPNAAIFSDVGPDLRWCGNESGFVLDPCYAPYTPTAPGPGDPAPGYVDSDAGQTGTYDGQHWMPAEVDVSIRPGWFWHESENKDVRTPANLMQLYMQSVGRGACLNLNAPPDRRGILNEADVKSLRAFGTHLRKTFAKNLAAGATVEATNVRGGLKEFAAANLLSPQPWRAWITDDEVHTPQVEINLKSAKTFNMIRLREDIRLGQRVKNVAIDAWLDGDWKEIAKAESIGQCRLWKVPTVVTSRVRIRVLDSPVCPALSNFGLFLEPEF